MTYEEAYQFQTNVLDGKVSGEQLVSVFKDLERGCTKDELTGFFDASRTKASFVDLGQEALDIVGTGGDGFNTINISTIASFVVAAFGQLVIKYGNRAATGSCGTADVLEALGANIEIKPENVSKCLTESNFALLFAPFYNPAFKHARAARKTYGKKTYFNILGPLLNPANPSFRLIGTSDPNQVENMLHILQHIGVRRAWIVSGLEGLDEISTAGDTIVCEYNEGRVSYFKINPKDYGLAYVPVSELAGGTIEENTQSVRSILSGQDNSPRVLAVVMNAAAGLVVAGGCLSMEEGILAVQAILKGGKALKNLDNFVKISNLA